MRHHRPHLLLVAVAALAVGVTPAWSSAALADAQTPTDTSTTASLAPESTIQPEADQMVDVADPAEPVTTDPVPTDDVPLPAPTDDVTDPTVTTGDSAPSTTHDGQPAVAEKADEGGGHEGGGHGEGGTLADGVTVTVDGRDITAGDPEGSLPKIASCTFDITASGLTVEPPDTVGVRIVAWPPTAPGEGRVKLVDVTETSADGAWAGSFPLDEAVQQFDRKGNGYHMRLEILINGEMGAMKMYWLGCGEPQTGNPRRMLFDVQWFDADGTLLTMALDSALPAGWRDDFVLNAAGERGTVECTYPLGSDLLACRYVNPGHGDQPGLVLPGKPGISYTVDVAGEPRRWVVDTETIGYFLADDTCPKGGGGHDDGHEEKAAALAADEGDEGGGHASCLHTVVINQTPVEPPPDDGDGGSANPPDDGDGGSAKPPDESGGGNATPPEGDAAALPTTGASTLPLLPVGLILLALGMVLVLGSRPVRVVVKT